MGTTRFSGPVYGAKNVLFSVSRTAVVTAQTALAVLEIDVPATENWGICEVHAFCTGAGSAAGLVNVKTGTTAILATNITLVANDDVVGVAPVTSGEDEGYIVASSAVLTVVVTTGTTTAVADLTVNVIGYRRSVDFVN